MGKIENKKKVKFDRLHKTVDSIPAEKVDYVQGILDGIILSIKQEEESANKKTNISELLKLAGTLKLSKNFDAVKWQRKLRDEWEQ